MRRTSPVSAAIALAVVCLHGGPTSIAVAQSSSGGGAEEIVAPDPDGVARRPRLVVQLGGWEISAAVFSPDGTRVLTASSDSTAELWDVATGRELRRLVGHTSGVLAAAFSPDGRHAVTGSMDKTVRVWDVDTGRTVRTLEGHTKWVGAVAVSPDGTRILTGSNDTTIRLWDLETGQSLGMLEGHTKNVNAIAFTPDGRSAITGSSDNTARLWDLETGDEVRAFEGHASWVMSVACSPDGTRVLTAGMDKTARLWDVATGQELKRLEGHAKWLSSVAFSPDGARALTGSWDETARLWALDTAEEVRRFEGHALKVASVAFSPDGAHALTGSSDRTARLWNLDTGNEEQRFDGRATEVVAVAFSPDGAQILTGNHDDTARLWDLRSGQERLQLKGHTRAVYATAFAPEGTRAITGSFDGTVRLWDLESGAEVRRFDGHEAEVTSCAFSPDGTRVLSGSRDKTARVWDLETGEELRRLEGHSNRVVSVAFSPNGTRALTGSRDGTARLWDLTTGAEVLQFVGHAGFVNSVAFAPDGTRVLTGGRDATVRLWDAVTGREVRRYEGASDNVYAVAISPDGARVLAGLQTMALLWDLESGRELQRFDGHDVFVAAVAFSPDGSRIVTGSYDATTRVWDVATGKELARLLSFDDGTWAVVDPHGRFDAPNGGDVAHMHWVVANEPIVLGQLKERFYEPRLLARITGFNDEPLRDVGAFDHVALYPAIALDVSEEDGTALDIALTNRGGGIGRVQVLINGKEIQADARGADVDPNAETLELSLDLTDHPFMVPGAENDVEVRVFNAEGYLSSRGVRRSVRARGTAREDPPEFRAIVIGTGDYLGDQLDLRFAAKDAEDIAAAMRVGAARLFGEEHVHLTLLATTDDTNVPAPTRQNIERAFEAARAAKPTDVLLVYLAGHGVTHGGAEGDFYYLTRDARSAELADSAVRDQVAISSRALTELINQVPALKQVLILDTCASGAVVERLTETRNVSSSQIRALDRMKDRTGMYVLAGCASDAVSYEATRFAQGLLTYSLLLGMRGGSLRDGEFVDVSRWFDFAADRVPDLARDIGGIQRPVVASPRGGASFDVGQVTSADMASIPLETVRPMFVRTNFIQDGPRVRDPLRLTPRVDDALRGASSRGRGAPLVYIDADEAPDAFFVSGRYRITDGSVETTVFIYQGDDELATFTVSGRESEPDDLARSIVERTAALAEQHGRDDT